MAYSRRSVAVVLTLAAIVSWSAYRLTSPAVGSAAGSLQSDPAAAHKAVSAVRRCAVEPAVEAGTSKVVLTTAGGIGSGKHVRETSQGCWEDCRSWPVCQSWFWCDQREGCIDFNGRHLPFKGCELRHREVFSSIGRLPHNLWQPSASATGVMALLGATHNDGSNSRQQIFLPAATSQNETAVKQRRHSSRSMGGAQGVIIATSVDASTPRQCRNVAALAVLNKADYARTRAGYEFHVFTRPVDKSVTDRFARIGAIRQLLAESSAERAEWIVWMDATTLLPDAAAHLPFHTFGKASLVLWGEPQPTVVKRPGALASGLSTSMLLVRNSEDSGTMWKLARQLAVNLQDTPHSLRLSPAWRNTQVQLRALLPRGSSSTGPAAMQAVLHLLSKDVRFSKGQVLVRDAHDGMQQPIGAKAVEGAKVDGAIMEGAFSTHLPCCLECQAKNDHMGSATCFHSCSSQFMAEYSLQNTTRLHQLGCGQLQSSQ